MAWIESESEHFQCRHSSAFIADAARVLSLLERTRERLADRFDDLVDGLTVVLHDSPGSLALSSPMVPVLWRISPGTTRRYVTGWAGTRELHVLSPEALRARASGVAGSYEMLALTPASLYVRRVIIEGNYDLRGRRASRTLLPELRWAWLLEGAARWLSGESAYGRAPIGQRMRDGRRPRFPPSVRDAPLLAAPLMDLLAQASGEAAVAGLTRRLSPDGPRGALTRAFGERSLMAVESDWRSELRRLAEGR